MKTEESKIQEVILTLDHRQIEKCWAGAAPAHNPCSKEISEVFVIEKKRSFSKRFVVKPCMHHLEEYLTSSWWEEIT
jgi:hypothetical protein